MWMKRAKFATSTKSSRMKYFTIPVLSFLAVFFGIACNNASGIRIEGTLDNLPKDKEVRLLELHAGSLPTMLLKTTSDAKGYFRFEFEEPLRPGIYLIQIDQQQIPVILTEELSKVHLRGNYPVASGTNMARNAITIHSVEGSAATEQFHQLLTDLIAKRIGANEIEKKAKESKNALLSAAITQLFFGRSTDYVDLFEDALERLQAQYPDIPFTKEFANYTASLKAQAEKKKAMERIKVGMPAPDIALPSPDGTIYRLSDLKGKVVLLDFWASWCRPCRRKNPEIVRLYHKYKNKGFTVFSVSLDGNRRANTPQAKEQARKRWITAIKTDKLVWPYHVSDLKGWASEPAQVYGVRSIPRAFLIDREGKIAAVNPRDLEKAIQDVLNP